MRKRTHHLWQLLAAVMAVTYLAACKDKPPTDGQLPRPRVEVEGAVKPIAFLDQRLASSRWEVRYGLLRELTGRDNQTKSLLETLAKDRNGAVAGQALRRYLGLFAEVDKRLFDPELFVGGKHPVPTILKRDDAREALLAYCLGRLEIKEPDGFRCGIMGPTLPTLMTADSADPNVADTITIVGMLGSPDDSTAVYPFAVSENDYVALTAAQALIRLGDGAKSRETLERLIAREVVKHLYYITEALYMLREIDRSAFENAVPSVLARVSGKKGIQPNWLNGFLLLAAEVRTDAWE